MSGPGRGGGFASGFLAGAVALAAVAIALVVLGDVQIGGEDESRVDEALRTIEDNYFQQVDQAKLEDESIGGVVDDLKKRYDDRFSNYFNARQLNAFESLTSGRFKGIGLQVSEIDQGLRVAEVYPQSPAERAGIERGDVITAVDGRSIAGLAAEVSTAKIRGKPGTRVELKLKLRDSGSRTVDVERAEVQLPAVDGRLEKVDGDEIGYVTFHTFSEGVHGELRQEIERLYGQGAKGLVLDLRGNGGGLLNEAVLTASIFVQNGPIVSTESRTQGDRTYDAVGDALDPKPVAVLVDRDTASAAEILTAALKINDLATVVGTRTFGKGTFQEVIHLTEGGALDLTIGQYLTADGKSILGEGVKPQVRVEDDPSTAGTDEALERALQVVDDGQQ